jgi:hypothetical protein
MPAAPVSPKPARGFPTDLTDTQWKAAGGVGGQWDVAGAEGA